MDKHIIDILIIRKEQEFPVNPEGFVVLTGDSLPHNFNPMHASFRQL